MADKPKVQVGMVCFAVTWLAVVPGQAQPLPTSQGTSGVGPRIVFENTTNDFGRVTAGTVVNCDFGFRNCGDDVLRIQDVHPDCGCTTADDWPRELKPGEGGRLRLRFASANFDGFMYKKTAVRCNATGQSNVLLIITGTVWQPVEVVPSFVSLGTLGDRRGQASTTVRITNRLPEPLKLEDPVSSSASFQTQLETLEPGREYELKVGTSASLTNGSNSGVVWVKTSAKEKPIIRLPVHVAVEPILVIPSPICVFTNANGGPSKLAALILNNQEADLLVSNPRINVDSIAVRLQELTAGKRFRVDLTVPETFTMPVGKRVLLSLETSNPDFPVLEIPLVQPLAPTAVR